MAAAHGSARPRVTLVVARARDGAIGRGNAIPWHLPEDLRHFKALTTGHALVMGRRTWDSIGRPLPGRRSIVVTRDPAWQADGAERAGSLEEALALAAVPVPGIAGDEVFVVGGGELYRLALPRATRAVVTEVALDITGADTFFEDLGPPWRVSAESAHVGAGGTPYRIVDWRRDPPMQP